MDVSVSVCIHTHMQAHTFGHQELSQMKLVIQVRPNGLRLACVIELYCNLPPHTYTLWKLLQLE